MCETGSAAASGFPRSPLANGNTSINMDGSRSLDSTCLAFLATLIDTKNFLERLEALFCKELLPKIDSQTSTFTSSSIEIQKDGDHMKDENARLLSKHFALQSELEQEKSRFYIAVQKALEAGMNDKLQKSLQEIHELQESLKRCQGGTDELQQRIQSLQEENQDVKEGQQKLLGENEELRQRVNVFEQENEELRQRQGAEEENSRLQQKLNTLQQDNSRLAGLVEVREEESDLLKFKMVFLEDDNQRLNKNRGEFEKLQILQRNRLTLKRDALPRSSKPFSPQNGRSPEQELASSRSYVNLLRSAGHQPDEKENRNDRGRDEDTTVWPGDVGPKAEAEPTLTPPQINNNVDNKAKKSPVTGNVGEFTMLSSRLAGIPEAPKSSILSTDVCKQEADDFEAPRAPLCVVDSDETIMDTTQPKNPGKAEAALTPPQINNNVDNKAEKSPVAGNVGDTTTVSSRLAGRAEGTKSVVSTDVCKQVADDFKVPDAPPGVVDSDETVMDITQRDYVGDVSDIPSVIPVANEKQTAGHQSLHLSSSPHASNEAGVPDAGDGPANQTRACLKSGFTRSNSPEGAPEKHDVEATSGVHVWRRRRTQLKSRTGDPHDNFLDTPFEQICAQLPAGKHEHGESIHTSAFKHVSHLAVENGRLQNGIKPGRNEKANSLSMEQKVSSYPRSKSDVINGLVPNSKLKKSPFSKKAGEYKFNEPVRRKRDRENLAATDCQQCSKFYNAVEADDVHGAMPARCEHRNAVSRHRFQNIPPPTPDGFWNIDFSDTR